jgi:hypothetical protein
MSRLTLLPEDLSAVVYRKLHASLMKEVCEQMADADGALAVLRCATDVNWLHETSYDKRVIDIWHVGADVEDGRRLLCSVGVFESDKFQIDLCVGRPYGGWSLRSPLPSSF